MRTLEEFKKEFYKKFPNSNIKIIQFSEKLNHQKFKSFVFVEDEFGICEVNKMHLLNGKIPSIKTSINKTSYFINMLNYRFKEKHLNYSVIEYKNVANVLILTKYGICNMHSCSLLRGNNGNLKSAINKTEYFINICKEIHTNKFNYDETIYINNKNQVIIECKTHGKFKITSNNLLNGQGCKKCGYEIISKKRGEEPTGWTLTNWIKNSKKCNNFDSFKVYIIECWSNEEKFYKIGRTYLTVKNRFCSKSAMPYNYKIIKEIIGDAKEIYNLETQLKKENKQYNYIPKLKFGGMYECFSEIKI